MKTHIVKVLLASSLFALLGCQKVPYLQGFGRLNNSDGNITASVHAKLNESGQFSGVPITIETQNARVRLSGYVKTIRQSDVAADLAAKVPGVAGVDNNLIVRK